MVETEQVTTNSDQIKDDVTDENKEGHEKPEPMNTTADAECGMQNGTFMKKNYLNTLFFDTLCIKSYSVVSQLNVRL